MLNVLIEAFTGEELILDYKGTTNYIFDQKNYEKYLLKYTKKNQTLNQLELNIFYTIEKLKCIEIDFENKRLFFHGDYFEFFQVQNQIQLEINKLIFLSIPYKDYSIKNLLQFNRKLLKEIALDCGLLSINVIFSGQSIQVLGIQDQCTKAQMLLTQFMNSDRINSIRQNSETCCICLDEMTEMYRLLACGHKFCCPCLRAQFSQAITDINLIPLTCGTCKVEVALEDIYAHLEENEQKQLYILSLNKFLSLNANKYSNCYTPNCAKVCFISQNYFTCSLCQKTYCINCRNSHTKDMSCSAYQSTLKADPEFQKYIKENDVKNCPKCKVFIEKDQGCHHMQCKNCNIHICWTCMATFETSKQTYSHLREVHGRIYQNVNPPND